MKPRYFQGTGEAPVHLASIVHERGNGGRLLFRVDGHESAVAFDSKPDLLSKLQAIIAQSVPLSIGGHCPGPADEVGMLISSGKLIHPYVEISWSAPECWMVREITEGAVEWESTGELSDIANQSFNPDALTHAG